MGPSPDESKKMGDLYDRPARAGGHAGAAQPMGGLGSPALGGGDNKNGALLGRPPTLVAQEKAVDTLIAGGTVYDGSEGKPFTGDVAISGDKIVFVGPAGKTKFNAKKTIDAKGMIVSPGFIDGHTHADHFLNDPDAGQRRAPAYITDGVSTVIIGVDGAGLPELKDQFAKYKQQGGGVNMASYVGYGTIRKRGNGDEVRD